MSTVEAALVNGSEAGEGDRLAIVEFRISNFVARRVKFKRLK